MRLARALAAVPGAAVLLVAGAGPAAAAGVSGAGLSLAWGIPFVGLLLSVALMPLVAGHLWHRHHGKIAAGWGALLVAPFAMTFGLGAAASGVWSVLVQDYAPFIALLFVLHVAGGGVLLKGTLVGTPATNTAILALGTVLASLLGSLGASLLLIRPILRANAFRRRKTHTFVFFIFLVGNIGGSLTPLGDPALYLGFLRGVPFLWTATHLFWPFLVASLILLGVYCALDSMMWSKERPAVPDSGEKAPLRVEGGVNLLLIGAVAAIVLVQGHWRPGEVSLYGASIGIERLVAIAAFVLIGWVSMRMTPAGLREANGFSWGAIREVAKLFAAIFVTIAPLLAILRAGMDGAGAPLVALATDAAGRPIPWVHFWLSGGLSAAFGKAPAYLAAFGLAGGDAGTLLTRDALALAAISCGVVFMGALSYIGHAPNFMVKAIVEESGERMPSFLGYCLWAAVFLLPLFVLVSAIFF